MSTPAVHSCTQPAETAAIPAQRAAMSALRPAPIADLTLAATSTAVNVGLLFLHHTLATWQRPELTSAGTALLSELVDQAVTLTGVPDPSTRWLDLDDLALIEVRLVLFDHSIVIEVADQHRDPPKPTDTVRSLSKRWHFYPTPTGRVVWCELEMPRHALTEHGLPKRKRSPVPRPRRAPAPSVDRDLLRRIHSGLAAL